MMRRGSASRRALVARDPLRASAGRSRAVPRLVPPNTVAAVARRPGLWLPALSAASAHVPSGWWRRPPFLPLPDRRWLRFRTVTAYGGDGTQPLRADDVVAWLEWRRRFPTS